MSEWDRFCISFLNAPLVDQVGLVIKIILVLVSVFLLIYLFFQNNKPTNSKEK
jgi:hypothetical protein